MTLDESKRDFRVEYTVIRQAMLAYPEIQGHLSLIAFQLEMTYAQIFGEQIEPVETLPAALAPWP